MLQKNGKFTFNRARTKKSIRGRNTPISQLLPESEIIALLKHNQHWMDVKRSNTHLMIAVSSIFPLLQVFHILIHLVCRVGVVW